MGVKTLGVTATPGPAPTFSFTATELNGCGWFLVIGVSCLDQNGQRRWLDLRNSAYTAYISGVAGPEAVNGHAVIAVEMDAVDHTNLLEAGATYDWGRLTGIIGPITQGFLTVIAFN